LLFRRVRQDDGLFLSAFSTWSWHGCSVGWSCSAVRRAEKEAEILVRRRRRGRWSRYRISCVSRVWSSRSRRRRAQRSMIWSTTTAGGWSPTAGWPAERSIA